MYVQYTQVLASVWTSLQSKITFSYRFSIFPIIVIQYICTVTFHTKEYSTWYSLVQNLRGKELDMSQINFIDSVDLAQIPQPTILL